MNSLLCPRRPSNPVIIAVSASLLLLFLLFQIGTSNVPSKAHDFISLGRKSSSLDNVFNSTLGFQKIFVISLPARTDRRDAMVLSAALSDIDIEFVDGVLGAEVLDKAIPVKGPGTRMKDGEIGCWRGHMDALQKMIQQGLSSVLIIEDDADWDIRLKDQLHDLALSTRALTQPLSNTPSSFADSTYPVPAEAGIIPIDLKFDSLPSTTTPTHSPYGDNWQFIWTGHCGMRLPSPSTENPAKIPKGRVVQHDPTVPQKQYLQSITTNDVKDQYPDHTRVVHHVTEGVCSLGYAVTQQGARRLLHDIGLFDVTSPYDLLLRQFCEGTGGRTYHDCLTMSPPLFKHHRPLGWKAAESDITSHGEEYRPVAMTENIRWSTRLNWDVLLSGGKDYVDQYPDT